MTHWQQPHWSGREQPPPDTRPRLKPNLFAKLARWSAHHAGLVIVMTIFFASLAAGLALFSIRLFPQAAPAISLDTQTASAQAKLEQQFPGIDRTFYAAIEHKNARYAHDSAVALAAGLRHQDKLFKAAFVLGTGDFYDRYGMLYLPTDDVNARVTHALQMQKLFYAFSTSPDIAGLAALAKSIAANVAQGNTPAGFDEVLRAMAVAVEAEIAGKSAPVDWVKLAGLSPGLGGNRWFLIVKPVPGQETAAALWARQYGSTVQGLTWTFPPHTFDGQPPRLLRDIGMPALLSAFMVLLLLAAGLGSLRQTAAVAAAGGAVLAIGAGVAAALDTEFDAVTWSLAAAVLAPALLFATTLAIGYGAARAAGRPAFTAVMLAAHKSGPRIAAFAAITLALWLAWLPRQIDSLAQMAVSVTVAVASGLFLTLTLVPAILTIGRPRAADGQLHWIDEAANLKPGPAAVNLRALAALVILGISAYCAIFVPNVKFGDPQFGRTERAALDTPVAVDAVHLIVPPDLAAPVIERLGTLEQVGAVRWIGHFLPVDGATKQQTLKTLAGLMQPPVATQSAAAPPDLMASLDEDLKTIANSDAENGPLREAAHRLRRALSLFVGGGAPDAASTAALEDALFAGLARLPVEAERLAALTVPQASDLDPPLLQHYASADGEVRIEVLPRPGVPSLSFAAAMRRAYPGVAGVPVVALARNEIMRREAQMAFLPGLLAALAIALAMARRPARMAVVLVPLPVMLTLSAYTLVRSGELVDAAALAAATAAMALCLATALAAALDGGPEGERPVTAFRAALLPLVLAFALVVPMLVSGSPAIASFAYVSSVLLFFAMLAHLLIAPQVAAWMTEFRSGE